MIIRLLFAIALLFALFYGFRKLSKLDPQKRKKVILQGVLYGLAGVVAFAVLTGRMHWIGAILAGFLAFARIGFVYLLRFLPFLRFLQRQSVFGEPIIKTEHIKVKINIQTGQVQGEIIKGLHEGKQLTSLTESELEELETYYKDKDTKSFYLIRAIIQKSTHFDQRSSQESYSSSSSNSSQPSIDEALQILGLPKNPTRKDIIRAHKSLMQKLHPDRGGNDFLAAQINNAKEVLINHFKE